jgi:hypothetical protein
MSSTTTLFQAASAVPYSMVFNMTIYLALLGGIALFFRPLLVGIGRALYLTVRPRRAKAQSAARGSATGGPAFERKSSMPDAVEAAEISLMNIRH